MARPQRQKSAQHGHRRADQNTERQRPTLVERGQDQKHKNQRQPEDGDARHAFGRLLFLEGHAEIIETHSRWHRFGEHILQRLGRLVRAVAGGRAAVDLRAAVFVVVHDEFRPGAVFHFASPPREGRSGPGGCARKTSRCCPGSRDIVVRFHIDLPLPAKAVKIIDKIAAHERLQRFIDLAQVQSLLEHFVAVHIDENLRHAGQVASCSSRTVRAVWRAAAMNLSRFVVRNDGSCPARSSRMKVKPPAVPTPGMAGGGKAERLGFGHVLPVPC